MSIILLINYLDDFASTTACLENRCVSVALPHGLSRRRKPKQNMKKFIFLDNLGHSESRPQFIIHFMWAIIVRLFLETNFLPILLISAIHWGLWWAKGDTRFIPNAISSHFYKWAENNKRTAVKIDRKTHIAAELVAGWFSNQLGIRRRWLAVLVC